MLVKLTLKLGALIESGRIKTKWSEIEDYGIAELIYMLFAYDSAEDSVAATVVVENRTVYMNLYEGIIYEHEGASYNLARAYLDVDNNVVFATPSGVLFLYEVNVIDSEDPKYYFGNE